MSGKGFTFKSKKIQVAPPELKDLPKPAEEMLSTKPSKMTTTLREELPSAPMPSRVKSIFNVAAEKAAARLAPAPAPPITAIPKTAVAVAKVAPAAPAPVAPAQVAAPVPAPAPAQVAAPVPVDEFDVTELPEEKLAKLDSIEDGDLQILAEKLFEEELEDPYETEAPSAYSSENRRSFTNFIRMTYDDYMLKPVGESLPVAPGDKYPYQKFIREYIRQASPYRGVLVYHGLGSGKTCTSIAASEALFSTTGRKIIVMTPFSLRKNFLKEVSFCGFRHYRLNNYWVSLDKKNPDFILFAQEILGLSDSYIRMATTIWVPDFRQEKPNYSDLSSDEQTEIRKQILSQLIWHPTKSPNGRIRFINYNGITKKELKRMACGEISGFFDNSVIIVDEIHNLVRLMQGKLEKYLKRRDFKAESQVLETITPGPYTPKKCGGDDKPYERGYYFYRLLLAAKNCKIIGLSGTPIINFPEELGILANILHGYQTVIEFVFEQIQEDAVKKIRDTAMANLYTDYVNILKGKAGQAGSVLVVTLLQPGYRKTEGGVERIPRTEANPTFEEVIAELKSSFTNVGLKLRIEPNVQSLPVLPPFGEEFRNFFLEKDGLQIKNNIVLGKRLSGLISYYKGSRQDLMPAIATDEIVRVPLSPYAQKQYSVARLDEISIEMKKKKQPAAGLGDVWGEAGDIGSMKQSGSYRMGSRQKCNFTFPPGISRPSPRTKKEQEQELVTDVADITDTAPDNDVDAPEEGQMYNMPELNALAEEEEEDEEEDEDEDEEEEDVAAAPAPAAKAISLKKLMKAKATAVDCKAPIQPGESYAMARVRARECLRDQAKSQLILSAEEDSLAKYSPKFAEILQRIIDAPGSSLLYSQFYDMEGISIFRIVMDINGFAPIEIINTPAGPAFSPASEESLRKGPGGQMRYITFSGAEDENVRRLALDVFNAKFNELPARLKTVLEESGYQENHTGQLCRVFCITSAGAEGLSLKNVRAVHIMEPYWNDVRLRQVKGRAIRIGSHLELPEDQRNVSIYTYVTVFGEQTQLAKEGEGKIDESIRLKDKVERKDAESLNLPIPKSAASYVLTSDERLFVIAERKKRVITELEKVMKQSAIDCELNAPENQEVKCMIFPLTGKVGDFLYNPILEEDIKESGAQFREVTKVIKPVAFKGVKYIALESEKSAEGVIKKFTLYAYEDKDKLTGSVLPPTKGETGAKDNLPAAPITIY